MIGNFVINGTIIRSDLEDANIKIVIKKWEKIPVSAMMTSNISGKRYLSRKGYNLSVVLDIYFIHATEHVDLTDYTSLTGQIITFKSDQDSNITEEMNCIVTPFRHNGISFYNAVEMNMNTVNPRYESVNDDRIVDAPVLLKDVDNPVKQFIKVYDNGNMKLLKYY